MYFVYSLFLTAGLFVLSPWFLFQAWRYGKYWPSLRERLGHAPELDSTRPVIWLHCVSVGETQAARPLARSIRERFPDHDLIVTTTTLTGQRVAREVFAGLAAHVFYFPFDWRFAVKRALGRVRPSLVLIMETEIWPNFLRECGKRSVPVAIVNGRLSERSFGRYRHVRGFMRRVLADLTLAAMQTPADADRMTGLGFPEERVAVTGNVKFDLAPAAGDDALATELGERFGFDGKCRVIVAASTHDPEEEVCLAALRELAAANGRARLILAPRHPERFGQVAAVLDRSEFTWARRTHSPGPDDRSCDAILLDSIGELRVVLGFADIVFVGGSIAPAGGHNVLEPAALRKCIVTGSHTANFSEIMRVFLSADALVQMGPVPLPAAGAEMARIFRGLLADDQRRQAMAERALAVVAANRGATERTIELIARLIPHTGPAISS